MFFDTKEGLSYIKCIKIAYFHYCSFKNELIVYYLYYNYDIMFLKFRNKGVSLEHKRQHWTKNQN